eukprot:SAG11_NODE_337_length_10541_cov_14.862574_4_plen_403_part_00
MVAAAVGIVRLAPGGLARLQRRKVPDNWPVVWPFGLRIDRTIEWNADWPRKKNHGTKLVRRVSFAAVSHRRAAVSLSRQALIASGCNATRHHNGVLARNAVELPNIVAATEAMLLKLRHVQRPAVLSAVAAPLTSGLALGRAGKQAQERKTRSAPVERRDLPVHVGEIRDPNPRDESTVSFVRTCCDWRRRWWTAGASRVGHVRAHRAGGHPAAAPTMAIVFDVAKLDVVNLGAQTVFRVLSQQLRRPSAIPVADATWIDNVLEQDVMDIATTTDHAEQREATFAVEDRVSVRDIAYSVGLDPDTEATTAASRTSNIAHEDIFRRDAQVHAIALRSTVHADAVIGVFDKDPSDDGVPRGGDIDPVRVANDVHRREDAEVVDADALRERRCHVGTSRMVSFGW